MSAEKIQLAIFASGGGSNARAIMEYFKDHPSVSVGLVVSNRRAAGVLDIAAAYGVPSVVVSKSSFYSEESLLETLDTYKISFIALAGFLLLVPPYIIARFPKRILNIHPALLPKFGGKGMYGHFVHEAVKAANESETGLTIHYATEAYDEGAAVFQARCAVSPEDTPESIAQKVLKLEHWHYPRVLEATILGS